jgi:agmatinase
MPDLGLGQDPAQPDRLPVPLAREIDQPLVQIAQLDPERLEMVDQGPHAAADLGHLRLGAGHRVGVRHVAVARAAAAVGGHRRDRPLQPTLLDGELEQDRAHLGQEGVGLLDRVALTSLGHRPMVRPSATIEAPGGPAPRRDGAPGDRPDAMSDRHLPGRGKGDPAPPDGADVLQEWDDFNLPSYLGSTTFQKLPLVIDAAALAARRPDAVILGAPLDDGVSHRPGARFGPRAIRAATYHTGDIHSLQTGVDPFDWLDVVDGGDMPIVPGRLERAHAVILARVTEVARTGAIPIVLGGDHSITYPSASAVAESVAPRRLGIVHFDAHADTGDNTWGNLLSHGTPMRRLIESGAVAGRNFVQVGLRGYWPPAETLAWMRGQEMRWHPMTEIESRGAEEVVGLAIAEALDGPEVVYLSVDIDVIDPGMAPGTGTPEPGGMLTRELLRAIRQVAGAVELVGMDVVEVAPPYDVSEVTAAAAHRCVLEALSALAARRRLSGEAARPTQR